MNFTAAKATLAGLTAVGSGRTKFRIDSTQAWHFDSPVLRFLSVVADSIRKEKAGPQASRRFVTAITAGISEGERNP
jgi:hypothetical protein